MWLRSERRETRRSGTSVSSGSIVQRRTKNQYKYSSRGYGVAGNNNNNNNNNNITIKKLPVKQCNTSGGSNGSKVVAITSDKSLQVPVARQVSMSRCTRRNAQSYKITTRSQRRAVTKDDCKENRWQLTRRLRRQTATSTSVVTKSTVKSKPGREENYGDQSNQQDQFNELALDAQNKISRLQEQISVSSSNVTDATSKTSVHQGYSSSSTTTLTATSLEHTTQYECDSTTGVDYYSSSISSYSRGASSKCSSVSNLEIVVPEVDSTTSDSVQGKYCYFFTIRFLFGCC